MPLSPQLKERIEKFKRSRRAYWSLILLTTFFVLSLPAEWICNDKPFVVKYDGNWYWPMFREYTKRDFGIESNLPIKDYHTFLKSLEPESKTTSTAAAISEMDRLLYELYGDDDEQVDIEALARRQEAGENVYRLGAAPPPPARQTADNLVYELYGDDNEQVDIEALVQRQDAGRNVYSRADTPPATRQPVTEMDRLLYRLYGDDNEQVDIEALARRQAAGEDVYALPDHDAARPATAAPPADDLWALWPPIHYNARTENTHYTTERAHLISPFRHVSATTGEQVAGAIQDGHYLGTDGQGRDVVARLVYGFRVSLVFGFGLALTGTVIGCLLGGLQGYFGGLTDLLGQRATEIWGSMPRLFLLIILSSFLASRATQLTTGQHFLLLFGILNLTAWMGMAGHMRAQFLRARNLDYVKAAKALGQSNFKIMVKHILPNSLVPVVTFVPFAITAGITALVSLDFLGFGVKYPAPSLGDMLAQGRETMAWWIIFPTFIILSVTLILLTFIGEGVRNAFDPRRKG